MLIMLNVENVDIAKIIIVINYFHKTHLQRCLAGFWICTGLQIYRGFLICQSHTGLWICLIVPHYAWIYGNMREYAQICLVSFCFTCLHCNPLSTWKRDPLFQLPIVIRNGKDENEVICSSVAIFHELLLENTTLNDNQFYRSSYFENRNFAESLQLQMSVQMFSAPKYVHLQSSQVKFIWWLGNI